MSEAGRQGWEVRVAAQGFLEACLYVQAREGLPPDHAGWILCTWPPDTWPQGPEETLSHSNFSPENSVTPPRSQLWRSSLLSCQPVWEGGSLRARPSSLSTRGDLSTQSSFPAEPVGLLFQNHGET